MARRKTKAQVEEEQEIKQRMVELECMVGKISELVTFWKDAGIPEETIVILIHDKTKIAKRDIRKVVNAVENLFEDYFSIEDDGD